MFKVRVPILAVCMLVAGIAVTNIPQQAHALGTAADAICVASQCNQEHRPPCPAVQCMDVTNGWPTSGFCASPTECKAVSTGGGPTTDISKLLEGVAQLMQQLQQGGGGGGGGFSQPCAATGPAPVSSQLGSTSTSTANNTTSDPCFGTQSGFVSPIFDASGNINPASSIFDIANTPDTSSDAKTISSLLDGTIANTNPSPSVTSSPSSTPKTTSNTPQSPVFGSVDGVSGDVRLQGNQATLLVSNRDSAKNTQKSGLYGFAVRPGITAETMYKSYCGMRIWSRGFLSILIPPTYFDSLCTSHGYALNARVAISAGDAAPKAAPLARVASTTAVKPPPPEYLGQLRADIWASPPSVTAGNRSTVFWDAHGALSCSLTSSDRSFTGSSLSGHAPTQALTKNTTFTINCLSATSTVTNQVVVTVQ